MSNYSPVYKNIWSDIKFTEYTPQQQLVFLYLITSPNCKVSGIYQVSPKQIAYSTNIPINEVVDVLKGFDEKTLEYDSAAGIVFIKNHFRYNISQIGNPKVMISTLIKNNELNPHCDFWQSFIDKYEGEIADLASRIKDPKSIKNNNSTLSQHLTKTYLTLNQHLAKTYSSVSQDLCSVSVSISNNKDNNINYKNVKEDKVKKVKKEPAESTDGFEEFWRVYSSRAINTPVGSKKKALIAYEKCLKKTNSNEIMEGLNGYLSECEKKGTYTAAVTTFLNQERYADYLKSKEQKERQVKESEKMQQEKMRINKMFNVDVNNPKFNEIMSSLSFLGKDTSKLKYSCEEGKKKIFVTETKFHRDWINKEYGDKIKAALGDYSLRAKEEYKHYFG